MPLCSQKCQKVTHEGSQPSYPRMLFDTVKDFEHPVDTEEVRPWETAKIDSRGKKRAGCSRSRCVFLPQFLTPSSKGLLLSVSRCCPCSTSSICPEDSFIVILRSGPKNMSTDISVIWVMDFFFTKVKFCVAVAPFPYSQWR